MILQIVWHRHVDLVWISGSNASWRVKICFSHLNWCSSDLLHPVLLKSNSCHLNEFSSTTMFFFLVGKLNQVFGVVILWLVKLNFGLQFRIFRAIKLPNYKAFSQVFPQSYGTCFCSFVPVAQLSQMVVSDRKFILFEKPVELTSNYSWVTPKICVLTTVVSSRIGNRLVWMSPNLIGPINLH